MTVKIQVSFEVAVDGPATLTAYGIALGYALKSAMPMPSRWPMRQAPKFAWAR